MNTCPACGINYEPSRPNQLYCSNECKHKGAEKTETRVCLTCRRTFSVRPSDGKKYCCSQCYYNRDQTETRKKYPICVCAQCGKTFEHKRSDLAGKYCSRACSDKADRLANRRLPKIRKTCPHCGREFTTASYSETTHCSGKCAKMEQAKTVVGNTHPLHKDKIEKVCEVCGKVCYVKPSLADRFRACSKSCAAVLSVRAQQYRTSSIEIAMYDALVSAGYAPTKQYLVAPFTIDLAFPSVKLAIECDGDYWHSTPWQAAKDKHRDGFLGRRGWTVLRIREKKIKTDIAACVALVVNALG